VFIRPVISHRPRWVLYRGPLSTVLLSKGLSAACLALCLGLATGMSQARADIVTFTLTGPAIYGTLGGVPFAAPFTITAQADPALMTFGTVDYGVPLPNGALPAVSTITIDGFSPVVFTDSSFGPFQTDGSQVAGPGFFLAGFGLPAIDGGIFNGFYSQGVVSGNALVDVSFGVSQGFNFETSGGTLIVNSNDVGLSSYGPIVSAAAVPEIDPAGVGSVLALVAGSLGMLERRRRRMA